MKTNNFKNKKVKDVEMAKAKKPRKTAKKKTAAKVVNKKKNVCEFC